MMVVWLHYLRRPSFRVCHDDIFVPVTRVVDWGVGRESLQVDE